MRPRSAFTGKLVGRRRPSGADKPQVVDPPLPPGWQDLSCLLKQLFQDRPACGPRAPLVFAQDDGLIHRVDPNLTHLGLRRAFHLAMESEDVQERVHLTNIYGQGCSHLVKLLKAEGMEHTRLEAVINDMIDKIILNINDEWGLK